MEENFAMFGDAARPHEHDWLLTLEFEGPLDPATGMLVDLMQVDEVLEREVLSRFHGRHINDVDPFFQQNLPTTENLALYFLERLQPFFEVRIARVRIAESEDIYAEAEQ